MLQVKHLSKHFGSETILSDVSFVINANERVGLVGPNGAGKSTLLRCVVGFEPADSGEVVISPPDLVIGYLPQAMGEVADLSLCEVIEVAQPELQAAERALAEAAEALGASPSLDESMAAYDAALAHFEALGGYECEHRVAAILDGLGLAALDLDQPVAALSGGQKTRLGMARLLLRAPDLLLLDEPTNHLDIEALIWLEGFIHTFPGAVLIVSHDREFLDRTVTRILHLDPETRRVRSFPGNYSDFAAARACGSEWRGQDDLVAADRGQPHAA